MTHRTYSEPVSLCATGRRRLSLERPHDTFNVELHIDLSLYSMISSVSYLDHSYHLPSIPRIPLYPMSQRLQSKSPATTMVTTPRSVAIRGSPVHRVQADDSFNTDIELGQYPTRQANAPANGYKRLAGKSSTGMTTTILRIWQLFRPIFLGFLVLMLFTTLVLLGCWIVCFMEGEVAWDVDQD